MLETTIEVTYTNRTGGPMYFLTACGMGVIPPVLEKRVKDDWVGAYAGSIPACAGPPFEIAPGASYTHQFRMAAGVPGSRVYPPFDLAIGGTYRLVWDLHEPRPGTGVIRQVRPTDRMSNSFRLYEAN